jgi:hypothetical protein
MMNARIEVLKSIAMACLVLGRINGYWKKSCLLLFSKK